LGGGRFGGPFSFDRAVSDAMAGAARNGEATVERAEGDSILPFFGNGAVELCGAAW
jgi:hypothetical protein